MRKLLLLSALALALPASAQTMTSQLQACQAIPDAQQRLACYDRISHGQPGVPPAPYSAPAPYAAPRPVAPPANYTSQFGEEDMGVTTPARRQRYIISEITDYKTDLRGKFIVTLANGQTWKQIEADMGVARPRRAARRVKIERGLLGSYNLTFNDMKPEFKVIRIH